MASKKVEMYAKKRYELDEIKNKIKEEFDKRKFSDVEFKDEIIRELGDTKTLLLIFENWFLRTGSYASLVIMLSEYQGYQSADIIATGGKEAFFSFGAEGDFAKFGEDALKKKLDKFKFIIKNPDIKRAEPLPFGGGSARFISAVLLRKWRPRPTSSGRRRRLPVRCGAHRHCRWPAPASVRRTTRAGRGSSGPSGR